MLHRNTCRLLKLVNKLLDFSRLEAGRIKAAFEPTDLCELTADLASSFRSTFDITEQRKVRELLEQEIEQRTQALFPVFDNCD